MRALFTLTIFWGSFLLFLVQPMAAKRLLPAFGGAPGVWNASLLFFQAALLAGYAYADIIGRRQGRSALAIHALVVLGAIGAAFGFGIASGIVLPDPSRSELEPALQLLGVLAVLVGLPYTLLATGAPLLQRWFARTDDPAANDPYFLYAASNLGSLAGLLSYPFLIEGAAPIEVQGRWWGYGLLALGALLLMCMASVAGRPSAPVASEPPSAIPWATVWRWLALAAVPSSLLMGVTSYITSNLASVPLLWVIPLALYLLTFVVAFRRAGPPPSAKIARFALLMLAPLAVIFSMESTEPLEVLGLLNLAVFGLAALACHSELAETRPPPGQLTRFYLVLSLGGVIGGVFNALLAPVVFNNVYEYPLALIAFASLQWRPGMPWRGWRELLFPTVIASASLALAALTIRFQMPPGWTRTLIVTGLPALAAFLLIDRPVQYGLALAGFLAVSFSLRLAAGGRVILSERSFFGVHHVIEVPERQFRGLVHGVTLHGRQSTNSAKARLPLTYYHPTGPIGVLLTDLNRDPAPKRVGIVGLGVGSLASYARPGDMYVFFEIDPLVIQIARNPSYFTFLSGSRGELRFVEGDARLSLVKEPQGSLDVLVIDAFSSDAIPMHLLTAEAIRLYLDKVKPAGVVAFHISNRYLSLQKVLTGACDELGLAGRYGPDRSVPEEERQEGKEPSQWFLIARDEGAFEGRKIGTTFYDLEGLPRIRMWTDARSNMLEAWSGPED